MFMGMIERKGPGRPPSDLPCPDDFDDRFIELGRLVCQEHYNVGRLRIDSWLVERGKQRLINERANHVRNRKGLSRKEIGQILSRAIPVNDRRRVSPMVARRAAHFLRSIRNGGWIVSQAGNGEWWVGSRRRSAAELLDLAKAKGFNPSLRGERG